MYEWDTYSVFFIVQSRFGTDFSSLSVDLEYGIRGQSVGDLAIQFNVTVFSLR